MHIYSTKAVCTLSGEEMAKLCESKRTLRYELLFVQPCAKHHFTQQVTKRSNIGLVFQLNAH